MQQTHDTTRKQTCPQPIVDAKWFNIACSGRHRIPPHLRRNSSASTHCFCNCDNSRRNRSWSSLYKDDMMATLQKSRDCSVIDRFDDRQSKHWNSSSHTQLIEQMSHCNCACTDRKKTILLSFARTWKMLESIQFESPNDPQWIGRVSQSRCLFPAQPRVMINARNLTIRRD